MQRRITIRAQERSGTQPWTQARIYESAPGANTFALIDTRPVPVDLDPSTGDTYTVQTLLAQHDPGDYRIQLVDANNITGDLSAVLRLPALPGPQHAWEPDVQEVAPKLRARLRATQSTEFTDTSTPSLDDAVTAVQDAVNTVLGLGEFPDRLNGVARSFVIHQAAATLETANYPSQTRSDQSPRPHWQTIADARWKTLQAGAGGTVDPGTGQPITPGAPRWTHSSRESISGRPW